MDLIKLIAIGGVGGASFASGSLLSGSGLRSLSTSHRHEPLMNPYHDFDLACVKSTFGDKLRNQEKLKQAVTKSVAIDSYTLPAYSATTGTDEVKGCFRTTFNQIKREGSATQIMGARMEMTISNGKQGIILMNHIANIKDYGVRMNSLRAIFLEFGGTWWEIKGGIQWTDETFLNQVTGAQKLKWNGLGRSEEIVWTSGSAGSDSLTKDPFSRFWTKDANNEKNIYQDLNITGEASSKAQVNHSIWSGQAEPLKTAPKLSAVFTNEMWIPAPDNANAEKAKNWFNLFKNEKGAWK